jgi:hypothetical protein
MSITFYQGILRKGQVPIHGLIIFRQFPQKQKSRRQHQADKGGLPIIESSLWVRSNSFVTTKN